MERIIITEVDNTSNVEALSSFDVVYVPGFSKDASSSLFRNPTLVTTRYEFLNKFGQVCPTFETDQPYPIATSGVSGFPSYAIPGYIPPEDPTKVDNINSYEFDYTGDTPAPVDAAAVIAGIAAEGIYKDGFVAESSFEPATETIYYYAFRAEDAEHNKSIITMKELPGTGPYTGFILFTSDFSPVNQGYKVKINSDYYYTEDSVLTFDSNGNVTTYYEDNQKPALMFNGPTDTSLGDADPGYRYALYLLSLGIPVYYEQMNCGFEVVDMNNEANLNANPYESDWKVEVGGEGSGVFVRTQDTSVVEGKVYYTGADISVQSMYEGLEARFANRGDSEKTPSDYSFDSMGDYAIKYITSGGYPTFEYGPLATADADGKIWGTSGLAEQMIRLAADRSDAVALIDHTNAPNRSIYETDAYSVISRVRNSLTDLGTITGSYGAMFTPWYTCTSTYITGGSTYGYNPQMPASLAFLSALAQQLQNYNPWLAVSGVARGIVPYCGGLHTNFNLTNNVADSYQVIPGENQDSNSAISINPITYIRNYGYCIWGNRTLRNNSAGTQATSFLNIRDLTSDIKKTLYEASQALMFEQNTDVLWLNFKALVTPILDRMVSNYILSDYNIVKYNVDPESGQRVPAYKVLANITIRPINSVEVFELRVTLENNDISVAETA